MNGRISFILVLLIVLAIPLFADHGLVNPVAEFSAISTLNEEVSFTDQELFDSNVSVLAVGLKKSYLPKYTMNITVNGTHNVDHSRRLNTIHGGVKRTNLRKH